VINVPPWAAASDAPTGCDVVSVRRSGLVAAFAAVLALGSAAPVAAETLTEALAAAYSDNPTLNAQRAALRATDEGVPQALAGFRPTVTGSADIGISDTDSGPVTYPGGLRLTVEQPLFTGHRTKNGVKIAETAVLAGRQALRNVESNILLSAATAFMDLVQAQAILNLRQQNVSFQTEQVRAAQDRLSVGEGTRTDVAQTEAARAAGRSQVNAAIASLNAAIAVYEQVIGHQPNTLGYATPVESRLPRTLDEAIAIADAHAPAILLARYNLDIAAFNVKVAEGALLPTAGLTGTLSHRADSSGPGTHSNSASLVLGVSVPIGTGGESSSKVRQAKETLSQRRIELDAARAATRQAVISAWGMLDAARAQIVAANARVDAERLVLSGVTEERKVGQRTTLDVLNAQQDLLDARVGQVSAQHDRVVAAYALLAAIGKLDAAELQLPVRRYDPDVHYTKVRDLWSGLRTPDGR